MYLLAAISLGFLGSFHCIGMCGPIALALPIKQRNSISIIKSSFVYNLGRIVTYACMGLLFGLVGQAFSFAGWQNVLSVVLGVLILMGLFLPHLTILPNQANWFVRSLYSLKENLRKLFGVYSLQSLFLIGLLNGLLPCGLVYLGIAGAIATGHAFKGALFMAAFGFGTFPVMMLLTFIRDRISIQFRERIRKIVPVVVGVMAVMLILRGLNLGIPFISPSVEKSETGVTQHQCCKKDE